MLRDVKKINQKEIRLTCPIHKNGEERNPSCDVLLINTKNNQNRIIEKGTVHCFTCGYTASFDEFLFLFLRNRKQVGLLIKGYTLYKDRPEVSISLDIDANNKLIPCTEDLSKYAFYHPYMYRRKLTDTVIDAFEIGWDKQTNSITFPIRDKKGNLIMVQRRSVIGKSFDNGYNSIKGSVLYGEHMVYLLQKKRGSLLDEIWITESPIDALTLWVYNIPAVAIMGSMATKYQMELLSHLPTRKLVMALDNDDAGVKGMQKIAMNLRTKILYNVIYSDGVKDINEADVTQLTTKLYFI